MTKCLKCAQEFTPIIPARLICDPCIDLRLNPIVVKPKRKKRRKKYKKKKKPRKLTNKRLVCLVCSRPFKLNIKKSRIRIEGRYCTKLCRDYHKFHVQKAKIRYNIMASIKTPVACKLCSKLYIRLNQHVRLSHNLTMAEYDILSHSAH